MTEEDFVERGHLKTRSSVDHICLNRELAERLVSVSVWEADLLEGKPVTDHNGVVVEMGTGNCRKPSNYCVISLGTARD